MQIEQIDSNFNQLNSAGDAYVHIFDLDHCCSIQTVNNFWKKFTQTLLIYSTQVTLRADFVTAFSIGSIIQQMFILKFCSYFVEISDRVARDYFIQFSMPLCMKSCLHDIDSAK